jgi:hypothetical protein
LTSWPRQVATQPTRLLTATAPSTAIDGYDLVDHIREPWPHESTRSATRVTLTFRAQDHRVEPLVRPSWPWRAAHGWDETWGRRPLTLVVLIAAASAKVRLALELRGTLDCRFEHESQILSSPGSWGGPDERADREEVPVVDVIVARCAGLDVHKNTVMACVRAPGPDGGRTSTVRRFCTFTDSLRQLRAWLIVEGVTQVAMEATGVYWKPVVRHEALLNRAEVKGLRRWSVAAG